MNFANPKRTLILCIIFVGTTLSDVQLGVLVKPVLQKITLDHLYFIGKGINPKWSPDGSSVAFRDDSSGKIIVISKYGTNRRVLTDGWEAKWSPNCDKLAIVKGIPGHTTGGISIVSLNPYFETKITGKKIGSLEWTLDGRGLVYLNKDLSIIYLADITKGTNKLIYKGRELSLQKILRNGIIVFTENSANCQNLIWSAVDLNGGKLALPKMREDYWLLTTCLVEIGNLEWIKLVSVDLGTGKEKIVKKPNSPPTYHYRLFDLNSEQGKAIIYAYKKVPGGTTYWAYLLNLKDMTWTELDGGYGHKLSPDGKWVVYHVSEQWPIEGVLGKSEIYLISSDGTRKYQLTDTPGDSTNFVNEMWPQWSPDGQFILYQIESTHEIYVAEFGTILRSLRK